MHNPVPSTTHEGQVRRNVACVNCRDSKVRCKPGSAPGQPCQRCAKQQTKCVVNKSHKRETKRSKLAQLEDELRSIKQVVNSKSSEELVHTPTVLSKPAEPVFAELAAAPEAIVTRHNPSVQTEQEQEQASLPDRGPTQSRRLGSHHVSGEDIEWYFGKYLECFHPFMPILRKKNPNECYTASQPLFWTIVYISSRRYPRDAALLTTLIHDYLTDAVWASAVSPCMSLEAVHALLLLAAWPLPTIRFSTDPSAALVNVALNACTLMGFYMGRGSHVEFSTGARQYLKVTDEEAASTWAACCALAQKTASNCGHPPPTIQLSDVLWKGVLQDPAWVNLVVMFDLQRFLSKFHTAMTAHIMLHKCASEMSVQTWEDEFELLHPAVANQDSDFARFAVLAARLELQAYYFYTLPTSPSPNFHLHVAKVFATARSVVLTAVDLENRRSFLAHAPQWGFRAVFDAGCILLSILHSTNAPSQTSSSNNDDTFDADALARHAYEVALRCSVRDYDLPHRGGLLMEAYWALRDVVPPSERAPRAWPNRVGAGIAFWTLNVFKDRLQEASHRTTRANRALDALRLSSLDQRSNTTTQDQPSPVGSDLAQDIDWSKFMDDFEWDGNDGIFLGLS